MTLSNKQLSHYRVEREIGQGGMATIYRAIDTRTEGVVALKVLMAHWARDLVVLRRFQKEGENARRLQHPNIAQVYDAGQAEGQHFIVMRYAGNGSMDRLIQRHKEQKSPMRVEEAIAYLRPVAAALDYAHSQGILHRDIKPSNVLIDDDEQLLLADFGIARRMDPTATQLTMTNQTVGTPAYMSPEQAEGDREIDARADIYSLGVMAYEMLTNELPFSAATPTKLLQKILDEPPTAPETFNPQLAPGVTFALRKVLSKDPANRYPSASEFLNALERGLTWAPRPSDWASLTTTTLPTAQPTRKYVAPAEPRGVDRRVWIGALLALLGFLSIAFAAYSIWNQRTSTPQPPVVGLANTETPLPTDTVPATPENNTSGNNASGNSAETSATVSNQDAPTATSVVVPPTATTKQENVGATPPVNATSTPVPTLTPIPSPTINAAATAAAQQTAVAIAKTATAAAQPTATWTATSAPPPPTGANFVGTWFSNFSELHLAQSGNHVTGSYSWYGDSRSLSIEGDIAGNRLRGHFGGDASTDFAFDLSADGKSFDGYWFYRSTGQQIHWCGVKSGPLPAGCGFSGTWLARSDYCYDRQATIQLVQDGRTVRGTFDNGNNNGTGRVEGTIGGFGDASQYSVLGNFTMDYDGFREQFQWDLLGLQDQQFTGWWQNSEGHHPWCGWRNGLSEPAGCGAPPSCGSSGTTPVTPAPPTSAVPADVWQTVTTYFDALNSRDFGTAYGLLSSFFQNDLCTNRSVCTIEQYGSGYQDTPETYIDPANVSNPHAGNENRYVFTAQESVKNNGTWGLSSPRTYCLLYENSAWKIHGVKLSGNSDFCG